MFVRKESRSVVGILSLALFINFVKSQQNIYSFGPVNITRVDGENNVYIPCPFSGRYNPFWSIDRVFYEAYSLPSGMIAASYGLLIPRITKEMNETTFQCFVSDVHGGIQSSSVGTLIVEEVPAEFQGDFQYFPQYNYNLTQRINLDHQHTIFNKTDKTLAWKGGLNNNCNNYQMISTTCDGMTIKRWPWQGESTMTIPTKNLIHGNDSEPLLLQLEAFGEDNYVLPCGEAAQLFEIEQSDVTKVMKVAQDGVCVDIKSESIPYVVLPYNLTEAVDQPDCFCPIIISTSQNNFDVSRCSCIKETIFLKSLHVSRVQAERMITPTYEFCFTNLTISMNESVFHFFESLRACINKFGREVDVNFRRYHQSFKVLVVLANPPILNVNNETGQVEFVSTGNGPIPLDFYTVIVTDVSGQEIFNKNYSNTTTTANIFESIKQSICSPYTLSVQARNSFGPSESNYTIGANANDTAICRCLQHNVNITLELLDKDGVRVNCSQSYESDVNLIITANKQQNLSVFCSNRSQEITFDLLTLDCDKSHTLEAYYIYSGKKTTFNCTLYREFKERSCKDKNFYLIITITLGAILGCTLLLFLIVTITLTIKLVRARENRVDFVNPTALNNSDNVEEQNE